MIGTKRKGALHPSRVPLEIRELLNRGVIETATLAEAFVVDFYELAAYIFPELRERLRNELSGSVGITSRMRSAASIFHAAHGLSAYGRLATHPSDTARGWAAYLVGADPGLSLAQRLAMVRPLADDPHFGVREWAWLALRPHISQDLNASLTLLASWTGDRSANIRRFAVESTRPRGVWSAHINELKQRPELALSLLEPLRADPSRYVQNSVANWLNDAAKSRPGWVAAVCADWTNKGRSPATDFIVRRALRTMRSEA